MTTQQFIVSRLCSKNLLQLFLLLSYIYRPLLVSALPDCWLKPSLGLVIFPVIYGRFYCFRRSFSADIYDPSQELCVYCLYSYMFHPTIYFFWIHYNPFNYCVKHNRFQGMLSFTLPFCSHFFDFVFIPISNPCVDILLVF